MTGKATRASIPPRYRFITRPLELIHVDISGPVTPTLAGSKYTIALLDDFTAKSDVFLTKAKTDFEATLHQ